MLRTKRFILGLLGFVVLLSVTWGSFAAEVQPDVIVFYREGCNDCRQMDELMDEMHALYPGVLIVYIEEQEPGAADLMWSLSTKYGIFPSKFPVIFAGDQGIVGSGRDKELLLRSTIRDCVFNGCDSPMTVLNQKPLSIVMLGAILVGVLLLAVWFL